MTNIISVTSSAPLSNTTIGSGVSAVVYAGGSADNVTVVNGGFLIVSAGGTADDIQWPAVAS